MPPPYTFFDATAFYALTLDGQICDAGSAVFRRDERESGAGPIVACAMGQPMRPDGAPPETHMLEGAAAFWEIAPVLMMRLHGALSDDLDPAYRLRAEVWAAFRDEEPQAVQADDARLWVSLLDHALGTNIVMVSASIDPRDRRVRTQVSHVVRYDDARDVDLAGIAKTWASALLEPDLELDAVLGRS